MAKHVGKAGLSARRLAKKRALVIYGTLLVFVLLGLLGCALYYKLRLLHLEMLSLIVLGLSTGFVILPIVIDQTDNPDELIDRADRGAEGEEKVAKILSELPDGYTVFNDVPCPLGNIDHIVVGPNGVFVVETKSHKGKFSVTSDGQLRRNGRPLEKDVVKQVWRQTFWLKEALESQLGETVFVNPIIVFVNGFVRVHHPVKGVEIVPGKWLIQTILKNRSKLSHVKLDSILQVLQALQPTSEQVQ